MTLEERFWSKVQKEHGCWIWTGATTGSGYGAIKVDGRMRSAHRVAWELVNGEIPVGLDLDHLCMIKKCVNPAHLEPVSERENCRRYAASKTHCKHGHLWAKETIYFPPGRPGQKHCKICVRENGRKHDAKRPNGWERQRLTIERMVK